MEKDRPSGRIRQFFDARIVQPILGQLKRGTTPEKLALSCSLGTTLTLFPVFGSTTLLCVAVGQWLKLNLPAMLALNYLLTPVQLVVIPLSIRLGESILGLPHITFHPATIAEEFFAAPAAFFAQYGKSGLAGILVWGCLSPFLTIILYRSFLFLFRRKVAAA